MCSKFLTETNRIEEWMENGYAPPTKVDIFPTQKCNLNCKFCEFPNTDPEEFKLELGTDELFRIVEEAGEMNVKTFGIIGGEPFIQKDMIKIMEKIKKYKMNGSITTNGTLLNERRVKKIVDMKWDLLRISIDGIGQTHDDLRGKGGTFSKIIKSLELFKKYGNSYPTIEINTVLTKENYSEIPEIVELANYYDINRIFLLPVIEFNEEASKIKIKEGNESVIQNLKRASELCEKFNIENNINEIIEDELYTKSNETNELIKDKIVPCFVPWYSISINAKGIATPCSQFEEKFGVDIRKKSLEEIWSSEEFKKLRERIARKDLPKTCSKCCAPLLEENKEIRKKINDPEKLVENYT